MKRFIALIAILLLFGCEEISSSKLIETNETTNQIPVELVDVLDGDTIKINYNGKTEKVRYLLIDTPELNHSTQGKQPLGEEAKARNEELLTSGDVSIEFDEGNRTDDYGRLLAYLYVDGVSVQETLLEEGFARVAYIFPPNTKYVEAFTESEDVAKETNVGIWQYENYATSRGFNSSAWGKTLSETENLKSCNIKGNINRQGKKIFHVPSGKYYEQTIPEKMFCTEKEAIQAGFKKSQE